MHLANSFDTGTVIKTNHVVYKDDTREAMSARQKLSITPHMPADAHNLVKRSSQDFSHIHKLAVVWHHARVAEMK